MLRPSNEMKRLINKSKVLKDDEVKYWFSIYKKNKNEKAQLKLLLSVIKIFANEINKNDRRGVWLKTIPGATYDDIMQRMIYEFYRKLPDFNPEKSKLSTWTTWIIKPIILNPVSTFGKKFDNTHKPTSLDRPHNTSSDNNLITLGDLVKGTDDVEANYVNSKNKRKIINALKKSLNSEEREIIMALMGFIPPRDEWKSKTGKVNIASIARGKGINHMKMHSIVDRIYDKLRKTLSQSKKYKIERGLSI